MNIEICKKCDRFGDKKEGGWYCASKLTREPCLNVPMHSMMVKDNFIIIANNRRFPPDYCELSLLHTLVKEDEGVDIEEMEKHGLKYDGNDHHEQLKYKHIYP